MGNVFFDSQAGPTGACGMYYTSTMRKTTGEIRESFKSAFTGMMSVIIAIASFIVMLWILITIVRVLVGLG